VEEIKVLDARDAVNYKVSLLEEGLILGTLVLDWSAFLLTFQEGDLAFKEIIGFSLDATQVVSVDS
jgi:hypothetical protein